MFKHVYVYIYISIYTYIYIYIYIWHSYIYMAFISIYIYIWHSYIYTTSSRVIHLIQNKKITFGNRAIHTKHVESSRQHDIRSKQKAGPMPTELATFSPSSMAEGIGKGQRPTGTSQKFRVNESREKDNSIRTDAPQPQTKRHNSI